MNLRVGYVSGTFEEVTCSAIDMVKLEEKFNISVARLDKEMKLTHLLFLAHSSLLRQGKTKSDFDTWVESVDELSPSETDPK
jgi:hypothetical protein